MTKIKPNDQRLSEIYDQLDTWWRHKKSGLFYFLQNAGLYEADPTKIFVIYVEPTINKGIHRAWVRDADQFFDGRFEPISDNDVLVNLSK